MRQECIVNPCDPGQSCSFRAHSTFCNRCASNEISPSGVTCIPCHLGAQPDRTHTTCISCPEGKFGADGFCQDCQAGTIPTADSATCHACPIGQMSAAGAHACGTCHPGEEPTANGDGCISCFQVDPNTFSSDGSLCRPCEPFTEPRRSGAECGCKAGTISSDAGRITCVDRSNTHRDCTPEEQPGDGVPCTECPGCVSCDGHDAVIKPGFGLSKRDAALYRGTSAALTAGSWVDKRVYECPVTLMCEGEAIIAGNGSSHPRRVMNCREGHDPASPMCAVCLPDWITGANKLCEPCKEKKPTLSDFAKLLALIVAIVLGFLCVSYAAKRLKETVERAQVDEYGREVIIVGTVDAVAPFYVYLKVVVRHISDHLSKVSSNFERLLAGGAYTNSCAITDSP